MSKELESFVSFCREVSGRPNGIFTSCASASAARQLRRRFYYLREQLSGEDAVVASALTIKVTGRLVHVMPKPQPTHINWSSLATGDPANEPSSISEDH